MKFIYVSIRLAITYSLSYGRYRISFGQAEEFYHSHGFSFFVKGLLICKKSKAWVKVLYVSKEPPSEYNFHEGKHYIFTHLHFHYFKYLSSMFTPPFMSVSICTSFFRLCIYAFLSLSFHKIDTYSFLIYLYPSLKLIPHA